VITGKTVVSSAITIDQAPTTYVEVGLSYDVEVKTMPAEPRMPSGFVASRKRRIVEATPIMDRTQNLAINAVEVPFSLLPLNAGASSTSFTGRKRISPILGYSNEAQITFTMTKPLFATVLAVEYKLSTGA
jgi:tetrahydromethanopterin S-methyltransferase subunit B